MYVCDWGGRRGFLWIFDSWQWDKTATAAAAASLKFNYVFRALKVRVLSSPSCQARAWVWKLFQFV